MARDASNSTAGALAALAAIATGCNDVSKVVLGNGNCGTASSIGAMATDASNAVLPDAVTNFGLLDATHNYYTLGSGLYPQYATATTTTANTTSGSADITVASAAGIAIGDVISANSPSFTSGTVWVSNIVGATVTMSANATATLTGASVTFGLDRFSAGTTAFTNTLGAQYGYFGAAAKGHSTWVAKYWAGGDYPGDHSLFSVSASGLVGGLFASRASDNGENSGSAVIGLGVLSLNDDTGVGHGTFGVYNQANILPTATVHSHFNEESSIVNGWTRVATDPYTINLTGVVANLRLDAGDATSNTNGASDAIEIINNLGTGTGSGKYVSGITITSDALDTSGGSAAAMAMATNQGLFWYSAASNAAWKLYSSATAGNATIVLGNAGVATMTSPTAQWILTDNNNARTMKVGVVDAFNAVIDSVGGGDILLKVGGSTRIDVGGATTTITGLTATNAALTSPTLTSSAINGGTIINLPSPTNSGDAATKGYADAIASGIVTHASTTAATTANLTATASGTGVGKTLTNSGAQAAFSVDGVSPAINSRVLVKDQTTQKDNGIYTLTTVGTGATNWVLTRATDFDAASASEVAVGASVIVVSGTANAKTQWIETGQGPFTVDTTAIVFSQTVSASNGSVNSGTIHQFGEYSSAGTAISGIGPFTGLIDGQGAGGVAINYAGTSCTNQFPRSLNAHGVATCATVGSADLAASLALTTPAISGGTASGLTGLAIRDTSAAFDVTLAATSSTALNAGRTLTLDLKNVAHTLAFGSTANTITFPTAPSYTVIGSGDTGTVTNTMLAGSIAGSKLLGTGLTLTDQIDQEAHITTSGFSVAASTTPVALTGLSQVLTAAGKYSCHGHVHFTTAPTTSNGLRVTLATPDTLTVTTLNFTVIGYNGAAFMATGTGTATALAANAIASTTAATDLVLEGEVNVNAGGTLDVRIGENVASGTIASTAGSARWECHRAS